LLHRQNAELLHDHLDLLLEEDGQIDVVQHGMKISLMDVNISYLEQVVKA
jgi:hypothetical protein